MTDPTTPQPRVFTDPVTGITRIPAEDGSGFYGLSPSSGAMAGNVLTRHAANIIGSKFDAPSGHHWDAAIELADKGLLAPYGLITSTDQLDALPEDTVVITSGSTTEHERAAHQKVSGKWAEAGIALRRSSQALIDADDHVVVVWVPADVAEERGE